MGSAETRTNDTLINFSPNHGVWGEIKENEGDVVIKPKKDSLIKKAVSEAKPKEKVVINISPDPNSQIAFIGKVDQLKEKYFIPDVLLDTFPSRNITYFETKAVLQTLTIPIKIRPRLNSPVLKDSFPVRHQLVLILV